jgi:hypothetical protein
MASAACSSFSCASSSSSTATRCRSIHSRSVTETNSSAKFAYHLRLCSPLLDGGLVHDLHPSTARLIHPAPARPVPPVIHPMRRRINIRRQRTQSKKTDFIYISTANRVRDCLCYLVRQFSLLIHSGHSCIHLIHCPVSKVVRQPIIKLVK